MSEKTEKTDNKPSPYIPVATLRFKQDTHVAGKGLTSAVGASADGVGKKWRIDFDVRIRHHRVTYYPPGKTEPEGVTMVPAEQVSSWDPA